MAEKRAVGHAYNIDFLNVVFAASSILLFISVIWMVWDDYDREWKNYQRRFVQLEMQVLQASLQQAERDIDRQALEQLEAERAAAQQRVERERETIRELQRKVDAANARLYAVNQRFQFAKATYDVDRYAYEVRLVQDPERARAEGAAIAARARALHELQIEVEQVTAERDALQEELRKYTGDLDTVEERLRELMTEKTRTETRLNAIAPSMVKTYFRDAPLLDFMAPTITVQQIVLPHIVDDVNFLQVPKADRCTTCHLAIDRVGYEEYPQPFRTHPNLDVYLGSASPHPINQIGCTVCHEGMGQSISFRDAAHTPRTLEQQHDWERQHHWEPPEMWDYPMLPLDLTEASCAKCHRGEQFVPDAPRLNLAYALYERAGCYTCHATRGFEDLRMPGPSLLRIEGKLTPEWVRTWLRNPRAKKPSTWMPQVWYLANSDREEDGPRNEAEIDAAVAYLFAHSEEYRPATPSPPPGDAARGERLVESVGCLGCHINGEEGRLEAGPRRTFGQPLQGVGGKTTYAWLYDWVREPNHYSPGTYMPSLRLTSQEAADIATYLAGLTGPAGEPAAASYDQEVADGVLREYLQSTMPIAQAAATVAEMAPDERKLELGRRVILRYGCFSCHDIEGFEEAQAIGTDLSEQGSKLLSQLDFAFVDLPHTKLAWFEQKLRDPRSFDQGRVLEPLERLRMPDFHASDEEVRLLALALMSFQKEVQPREALRPRSARADALIAGRNLVRRHNCVGCHVIEDDGGDYQQVVDDPSLAPPPLTPQGAKVQHAWMFDFLHDPITIRPWLDVRMPSFPLDDAMWNRVIQYVAAISDVPGSFRRPALVRTAEARAVGKELFDLLRCQQCHVLGAIPADQPTANLAPDLRMAAERLQADWILDWMRDPQAIQPGTRMPDFWTDYPKSFYPQLGGDAEAQIRAIRDYLLTLRGGPSPRRTLPPAPPVVTP